MKPLNTLAALVCLTTSTLVAPYVQAGQLTDRIATGQSIRIGFANEPPYGFPGDNGEPKGIVNTYVIAVLHKMGYDNVEPVVADWGGLIPGLQAGRLDIITGGFAILGKRCSNVTFSEPMMRVTNAFIVKQGNPEEIHNYKDLVSKNAIFVTGQGYGTVENAKKEGVPEEKILQVPGQAEILAAVLSGRAAAGGSDYLSAREIAKKSPGKAEVTDPDDLPDQYTNYVGVGFSKDDKDFVKKFNEAQKQYLGTPEMLKAVAEYGYDAKSLPGNKTAEWLCGNR